MKRNPLSVWCRECRAYRFPAPGDRSLCGHCRQPFLTLVVPTPDVDEERAADAREEAAIVTFLKDVLRKP